ncbi:terminase [Salmonella enterica subsp. enterica serovar Daytona]|uniref:Terminase n=1 Tax=Salmonella enterica subsp. enterica serovar Daytona TaxID=1962639 RepID=A0A447JGY9_SALET|nr:terminase [Salmonella enterica subsp. enterica serovar Daytona]
MIYVPLRNQKLNPGTIDYERYRLTKAQADAQELKNAEREGLVLETELFTYILQRVASGNSRDTGQGYRWYYSANILNLCQSHIDVVRTEIARASGRAATIADVEKWTDDFRRAQGE